MARKVLAFALLACPPVTVALLAFFIFGTSTQVAVAFGCLSSFAFCDMWYFLRMAVTTCKYQFLETSESSSRHSHGRRHLFAVSEVPGRISLMDIDRNAHCNNARFLRECGFGRRDLWQHNGVWKIIIAAGGNLVVGAQTVRYRRELSFGQAYTLQSRLICWDRRAFYVEHRFVTIDPKNKNRPFVNAIVLVKNTVLGPLSPKKIVAKLPDLNVEEDTNPPMPEDIKAWIESNDASSKMLRAE